MSANIPFEVQSEIIKRVLHVKSLIRFRSVSKQWKSLIDSSKFINHHSLNQTHPHPHHLLVSYKVDSERKYVSIVDDDSFPNHKFSPTVKQASISKMLSSSHGLVCLNVETGDAENRMNEIIVWNPSIRKSVRIQFPRLFKALRFGVCPKTCEPKILKITRTTFSMNWSADVFGLSSMTWRNVPINLSNRSILFLYSHVAVDGVIYWIGYDFLRCHQIISFDLTSEEFGEIELPDGIASFMNISISNLKDCVVVLNYHIHDARLHDCDVWMMLKNDDSEFSFTKLYTVNICCRILGFRKNRQPIIEIADGLSDEELKVYELCLESYSGLGIYGTYFNITSYTESLLLLNHPDSITD